MPRNESYSERNKSNKYLNGFKMIANTFLVGAFTGAIGLGFMRGCNENPNNKNQRDNLETRVIESNDVNEGVPKEVKRQVDENGRKVDYNDLYSMTARHEGVRKEVYEDTERIKTIGAGFNLEREGAEERIEDLGLDYEAVCSGKQELSKEQIYSLMKEDVETAIKDARYFLGDNWNEINPDAKEIVVDMAYNLGRNRLSSFKNFKKELQEQDYQGAAREMKNSKWYHQVGNRSKELVKRMRGLE